MSELRLSLKLQTHVDPSLFYDRAMIVLSHNKYCRDSRELMFELSLFGFFTRDDKDYGNISDLYNAQMERLKSHQRYIQELSRAMEHACFWMHQLNSMINGLEHSLKEWNQSSSIGSVTKKNKDGYIYDAYQLKRVYWLGEEQRNNLGCFFEDLTGLIESRQIVCDTKYVATGEYLLSATENTPFDIFTQYTKIKQADEEKKNRLRVVK